MRISFEELVALVDQLPAEQRQALLNHLQRPEQQQLSKEEWIALWRASISSPPVKEQPSIRREDWYDDDGR